MRDVSLDLSFGVWYMQHYRLCCVVLLVVDSILFAIPERRCFRLWLPLLLLLLLFLFC